MTIFLKQNTHTLNKYYFSQLIHVLQDMGITFYPPYKNFVLEISIKQGMVERIQNLERTQQASTSSRWDTTIPLRALISATIFNMEQPISRDRIRRNE